MLIYYLMMKFHTERDSCTVLADATSPYDSLNYNHGSLYERHNLIELALVEPVPIKV